MEKIKQPKIYFKEEGHIYYDDNNERYESVTTFISNFFNSFNSEYWSAYTALKNLGYFVKPDEKNNIIKINNVDYNVKNIINSEYIKKEIKKAKEEWLQKNINGCERGNKIHIFFQNTVNKSKEDLKGISNNLVVPFYYSTFTDTYSLNYNKKELENLRLISEVLYQDVIKHINMGYYAFAEKIVYSSIFKKAGQIDLLFIKDKFFKIKDYKTNNKNIDFFAGYYKKFNVNGEWVKSNEFIRTFEKFKKPIENLENCLGIKYSLQLSMYAYMMELWGYKLENNDGLSIHHIRDNYEPCIIPVKYLKKEIIKMLNYGNK